MIWLFLTPSPVSKLDRRLTGRLRKRDNLLIGKGGGEARRPGPLEIIQYSLAQTLVTVQIVVR
jgi:hypothetical protein